MGITEITDNHRATGEYIESSTGLFTGPIGDIFIFLIPCLMFIEVNIIGRLFLSEIILFVIATLLIPFRWKDLSAPLPKRLIFLSITWLGSQIITDFVRATPFNDWSRGWAKIFFFLVNFIAIYLLIESKWKRVLTFGTGICIGQMTQFFLNPSLYAQEYPWKFGFGFAVTFLLVLATQLPYFRNLFRGAEAILMFAFVLNIALGFRSLGLICLCVVVYLLVQRTGHHSFIKQKYDYKTYLKLIMLLAFLGFSVSKSYEYVAMSGWLGEDALVKYVAQSSGKLGLIGGGRIEFLASSQAIIDSPVIGHGSWAKDPKYASALLDRLTDLGYELPWLTEEGESDLIPSHSYILGAWVESGIVGAIFWFNILVFVGKTLKLQLTQKNQKSSIVAFIGLYLMWNILFSPLGAEGRLNVAFQLVLLFSILSNTYGCNNNNWKTP